MQDTPTRMRKVIQFFQEADVLDLPETRAKPVQDFAEKNSLDGVHEAYQRPYDLTAAEIHNYIKIMDTISRYGDLDSPMHKAFPEESKEAEALTQLWQEIPGAEKRGLEGLYVIAMFDLWDQYREQNNQLHQVQIDDSNIERLRSVLLAVNEEHAVDEIARLYGYGMWDDREDAGYEIESDTGFDDAVPNMLLDDVSDVDDIDDVERFYGYQDWSNGDDEENQATLSDRFTEEAAPKDMSALYNQGPLANVRSRAEHENLMAEIKEQAEGLSWSPTIEMLDKIKAQLDARAEDAAQSSAPQKQRKKGQSGFKH